MKLRVLLLTLSIVYGHVIRGNGDSDPRCPLNENENSEVTLLPHESDCSKFYSCVHGKLAVLQCEPGLLFNSDLSVSDIVFDYMV